MEGKLQVTFRKTLLNPCNTRLYGLSTGIRAPPVGETQKERKVRWIHDVTTKNGGKQRKTAIF